MLPVADVVAAHGKRVIWHGASPHNVGTQRAAHQGAVVVVAIASTGAPTAVASCLAFRQRSAANGRLGNLGRGPIPWIGGEVVGIGVKLHQIMVALVARITKVKEDVIA